MKLGLWWISGCLALGVTHAAERPGGQAAGAANPEEFPPGFTAVGDWNAGIPGADPEVPTRICMKEGGFCIYKPRLEGPAAVTISIYRVSESGSSGRQRYEVHHHGSNETVEVEFAGVTGWHTLGTFAFDGSGREYLKLARGRTAEVKFTLRAPDGKQALRSIVIPTGPSPRPPLPPADGAARVGVKAVPLPPRPADPVFAPVTSLQLPPHISDGMVIQRGKPIVITGKAPAKATVSVTLAGATGSAVADGGVFRVVLPAMPAGGPYALTIRCGTDVRVIREVLLGDVWIVAGQSNMAFVAQGLEGIERVLADANYPQLRYYKQYGGAEPKAGAPARWVACTPQEARGFTAVGFLFARRLHRELQVPIGLVYAWRDGGDIRLFMRDEALAGLAPRIPFRPGSKPRSTLFSDFLAPLVGYGVSGLVYYQGEGNQKEPLFYRELMPAMVKDIRALWGQGDFPFIYIQLPRYKDGFVGVREAQFLAQAVIPNSAMVVSIDTGDANLLHPRDKVLIGERAAQAALGLAYHRPGEYTGPMFAEARVSGKSMLARFTHVGSGLEAHGELEGFLVSGEDGGFVPARGELAGPDTVRVWGEGVARPVAVRYLWRGAPRASLYNREGFPASPFRSDPTGLSRVVDNSDPQFSTRGRWEARALKGTCGGDCLVAADTRAADGECNWHPWAKWGLEVSRSGVYSIYLRWPEGLAGAGPGRVEVNAGGYGYPPLTVAQGSGGGEWHPVGRYRLEYGNGDSVKLVATGPGVAADAVKLVFESEGLSP